MKTMNLARTVAFVSTLAGLLLSTGCSSMYAPGDSSSSFSPIGLQNPGLDYMSGLHQKELRDAFQLRSQYDMMRSLRH